MLHYRAECPNCASTAMREWGVTIGPERLHYSQTVCSSCGLVFSNPVCDWLELEAFYRGEYWETHWSGALARDPDAVRRSIDEQRPEVERLVAMGARGRLLEIGSGTGGFLVAAREAGFEVQGVETSSAAVRHAREVFGLESVIEGSIPHSSLESASYDAIYAWHVIEHVVDLNEFVSTIHDLLRPGGLLWLGTENYRNSSHYLERAISIVRRMPPPFSTATEHTFVFNRATLADALRRRGFRILFCETYQPTLEQKLRTMHFRSALSRLYFVAQHAANAVARTGPLMRLAARKA